MWVGRLSARPPRWLTDRMGELLLIRHGETTWSASRRHTSYTDLELTPDGERQARALAAFLAGRRFVTVLASPRSRALRTAELAGLTVTPSTRTSASGTTASYEGSAPQSTSTTTIPTGTSGPTAAPAASPPRRWANGSTGCWPASPRCSTGATVALVGHAHSLRVLGARWLGLPPSAGGRLRLETATVSALGHEHGRQVILRWNQPAPPAPGTATDSAPQR